MSIVSGRQRDEEVLRVAMKRSRENEQSSWLKEIEGSLDQLSGRVEMLHDLQRDHDPELSEP